MDAKVSKSKMDTSLIFVEFSVDNQITDIEIDKLSKDLNGGLNGVKLEIEVRKNWF